MGLPEDAGTVFSDGDTLPAAEINTIKDCITGGKHGNRTLLIPAAAAHAETTAADPPEYSTAVVGGRWASTGAGVQQRLDFPIPLHVGDRIQRIKVMGKEGNLAAEFWTAEIYQVPGATGTAAQVSGTKTTPGGAASAQVSVEWTDADADIPLTLVAETFYVVTVVLEAAAVDELQIYGVEVEYDRP